MKKLILFVGLVLLTAKPLLVLLHIEFIDVRLNYVLSLGFFLSPLIILIPVIVYRFPRALWIRVISIAGLSILSLLSFVAIVFELLLVRDVFTSRLDPSYEKLHEIQVTDHYYTCYRSNGGATTDYGIDIRREKRFFGFVRFQIVSSLYHAHDARFSETNGRWFAEILRTRDMRSEIVPLE